jgi:hypothetical protein
VLSKKLIPFLDKELRDLVADDCISAFQAEAIMAHFRLKYKTQRKLTQKIIFFSVLGIAVTILSLVAFLKFR